MQVYTVAEVAEMLRVTEDPIRRAIARKELRALKVGSSLRIRQEDLDEYLGIGAPPMVDEMKPEVDGEYEGRGWGEDEDV